MVQIGKGRYSKEAWNKWEENKDWLYSNLGPITVRFFTVALSSTTLSVWRTPPLLSCIHQTEWRWSAFVVVLFPLLDICCLLCVCVAWQSLHSVCRHGLYTPYNSICVQGGADKSLARPGRKQATATKLGVYSTYSIWSIISGVVTVLGHPGRGVIHVEKVFDLAYDGACSPNVSVRMAWISFGALPCRRKNLDDSSLLDVGEIARVAWHASFQPL